MSQKQELLKKVEDEMIKCMKCGNCMSVCPIYKENNLEAGSARGKIQIAAALLKGELYYTKSIQEKLQVCLTCKACNEICPCGVKPDEVILATRAQMAKEVGLPFIKKSIFKVVSSPKLFDLGMKMGAQFKSVALKEKDREKFSPRFPIGLDTSRVFPALAKKPFRDQVSEENKPHKKRGA